MKKKMYQEKPKSYPTANGESEDRAGAEEPVGLKPGPGASRPWTPRCLGESRHLARTVVVFVCVGFFFSQLLIALRFVLCGGPRPSWNGAARGGGRGQ